jgi:hypothetical protein
MVNALPFVRYSLILLLFRIRIFVQISFNLIIMTTDGIVLPSHKAIYSIEKPLNRADEVEDVRIQYHSAFSS